MPPPVTDDGPFDADRSDDNFPAASDAEHGISATAPVTTAAADRAEGRFDEGNAWKLEDLFDTTGDGLNRGLEMARRISRFVCNEVDDRFQRAAAAVRAARATARAEGGFADRYVWTLGGVIDVLGAVECAVGGIRQIVDIFMWWGALLYKLAEDCFHCAAAAAVAAATAAAAEAEGRFAGFDVWTLGGIIDVMEAANAAVDGVLRIRDIFTFYGRVPVQAGTRLLPTRRRRRHR